MIKPLSIEATIDFVHPLDPAVDESSDLEGYMAGVGEGKVDLGKLKYKDGQQPTTFVVGVIPSHRMATILGSLAPGRGGNVLTAKWDAFLASMRDIKNGPTMTETDKQGRAKQVVPKVKQGDLEYVDGEWLGNIFVRGLRQMAWDIGAFAIAWNQLDEETAKN